jgi:hypothetical protein
MILRVLKIYFKKSELPIQVKFLGHKEQHSKFSVHPYSMYGHNSRCTVVTTVNIVTQVQIVHDHDSNSDLFYDSCLKLKTLILLTHNILSEE